MTIEPFKILLADDDATVRLLMQAALEKAGFSVTLACNGEEANRGERDQGHETRRACRADDVRGGHVP